MSALSVAVLIDYQNMHLTGHGEFAPEGQARHLTLLHPLTLSVQLLLSRTLAMGTDYVQADLTKVIAFRGLPSNAKEPSSYRRSQAQMSEWTRDRRVEVNLRPLRYPPGWPDEKAQEKGVDVLLALRLVRAAERHEADVLILATHDTDLEPALVMAEEAAGVQIETAGWANCKRLRTGSRTRRHTSLGLHRFINSQDLRVYA